MLWIIGLSKIATKLDVHLCTVVFWGLEGNTICSNLFK